MTKRLPTRFRSCEVCGKEFQIKNTVMRFCSKACGGKAWSAKHPGYMAAAQRKYLQNPESKEKRQKYQYGYRHRPNSIAKANDLRNRKYINNPEYREIQKARARAHSCAYKINHTREEWEELKLTYGNRCAYCGRKMRRLTKDHIVPISKGDPMTVDKITNIVPACKSCNSKKNNRAPFPYQIALSEAK